MSAGSFPVTPEDSPSHLDDGDYDDGSAVTISVPVKGMEKKEDPPICKPAKKNNPRKFHISILYVLVAIGFVTWIILFFLALEKYSEISNKIENLNLNYSEKFAKMRKDLDYIKTTQLKLQQNSNNMFTETEDILEPVCSQGNITTVPSCPFSWKRHRKDCYYFSIQKTNWTNALLNCINREGYLVSISSDEEQDFLRKNIHKVDYWLGISDLEGQWKWKGSGMQVETSFWDRGEPTKDEHKHCGIMHPIGTWASAVCSAHKRWICQKKLPC
ncbi:CD209 antigen-like protein C isoform X2 [Erythrolamprus reginae]